jgi:hypothetical protein
MPEDDFTRSTMKDSNNRPEIVRQPRNSQDSVQVKLNRIKEDRHYYSQEQLGIDKIVEDSESSFYVTGKTVKMNLIDFLNLAEKHDISTIDMSNEEIVLSSSLITQMATAEVIDEDEDKLKLFDATAVGLFISGTLLSLFALFTKTMADIKTFSYVILGVSAFFLAHYAYKGTKTGEIKRLLKAWGRKISKDK